MKGRRSRAGRASPMVSLLIAKTTTEILSFRPTLSLGVAAKTSTP